MPALTRQQLQLIKQVEYAYTHGATIREIASEYDISYGKVWKILHTSKVPLRRRGVRPK